MNFVLRWSQVAATLLLVALASGCSTLDRDTGMRTLAADSAHVRHLRFRVAPPDVPAFEHILRTCADRARATNLPGTYGWLCYREAPGRYWIIYFSDSPETFVFPATLPGFVGEVFRTTKFTDGQTMLQDLNAVEVHTEWEIEMRQRFNWSTVENMATATHPKARMVLHTVRHGSETAFESAMEDKIAFLRAHGYPIPIEGFVIYKGTSQKAMEVIFPTDWPSFYVNDSFSKWTRTLDADDRVHFDALESAVTQTLTRQDYIDGDYVNELSYN